MKDEGARMSGSGEVGEPAVHRGLPATGPGAAGLTPAGFRISVDAYRGPLELLLYLVRKHEIDVLDIPIAHVTAQFVEYLDVLQELNVDDVADFVDMASSLLEIKSRLALPGDEGEEIALEDPREELVQRLLEYKQYKDAASLLEERSREWQQRYPRLANDCPDRDLDLEAQPIAEAELWDLVSAFGRIIRERQRSKPENVVYDDTPIHVYMQRIHGQLATEGRAALSRMFEPGMHKSSLLGVFLAILELVRHHSVRAEQPEAHGEIWLTPGRQFQPDKGFEAAG
jgi:segregation and condensation protein A